MSRSSDATSKASLSTLTFRETRLRPAGISLDEVSWAAAPQPVVDICRSLRNFTHTVPHDIPLAQSYIVEGNPNRIVTDSATDPDIKYKYRDARARYATATDIVSFAGEVQDEPENRWHKVIETACGDLLDCERFKWMSDILFNAQPHPLESAASLPVPKPDYAFGFQLSRKRLRTQSSALDPFSMEFIERLKEKPGLYLNPHVNVSSQIKLVYPFFCFEAKSSIGTPYAAANQLANDLAFALGLLLQLRRDADGDDPGQDDPLVVFGATSSGSYWSIYVVWEADRNTSPYDVCMSKVWLGDVTDIGGAIEFLSIMQKIKSWAISVLQVRIRGWLQYLADLPTPTSSSSSTLTPSSSTSSP